MNDEFPVISAESCFQKLLEHGWRIIAVFETETPTHTQLYIPTPAYGLDQMDDGIRCQFCRLEGPTELREFQEGHLKANSDCPAVKAYLAEHFFNLSVRHIDSNAVYPQIRPVGNPTQNARDIVTSWLDKAIDLPHAVLYSDKSEAQLREGLSRQFGASARIISSIGRTHRIRIDDPVRLTTTEADLLQVLSTVAGGDPGSAVLCTKSWLEWEEFLGGPRDLTLADLTRAAVDIQMATEVSRGHFRTF